MLAVAAMLVAAAPALAANGNGNANGSSANATANQQTPQNGNASIRVDQPGSNDGVVQGNDASSAATADGNGKANGNANGAGAADGNATGTTDTSGNGNGIANGNSDAAAPGNGNGNANANSNGNAGGGANGNGLANVASATVAQTSPTNANVVVRVGSPGAAGDVTQANTSSAAATGTDAAAPPTVDAGSSAATATTAQTAPTNTNVDVRINSPGDGGPVTQSNSATAVAASDSADSAIATATQTAPTNLNVTIRIGSGGDNGQATQTNAAQAGPQAASTQDLAQSDPQSADPAETQQTVTTSAGADSSNTSNIDQSIEQTQDAGETPAPAAPDPADTPTTAVTAAATAGPQSPPTGTVDQTGPQNINVSIRIASPGSDHSAVQADNGPIEISTGANTDIHVTVPGDPAAVQVGGSWSWTWAWSAGWSPAPDATAADVAPTGDAAWNWDWRPAADPATDAAAAPAPAAGTWTWTWTWTLPSGEVWIGGWQRPCDCSWTWVWNWDSSSVTAPVQAPADAPDAPPQPASIVGTTIGLVTQQNSVGATATATVSGDATQSFEPSQISAGPGDGQLITAQQAVDTTQQALATATATQLDTGNLNVDEGVATASTRQTNAVTADATAAVTAAIEQGLAQQQDGDGYGPQAAGAVQLLTSAQSASADSAASQQDAQNTVLISSGGDTGAAMIAPIEQWNVAAATASAAADAALSQWTVQVQALGASFGQEADATQTLTNAQSAGASADASQVRTANLADLRVPAGSRATNPSLLQQNSAFASATATDGAVVHQSTIQSLGGTAGLELALATQDAANTQDAHALAPAAQSDLLNRSGWLGVEPSPLLETEAPPPQPPPPPLEIAATLLVAFAPPSPLRAVFLPGLPAIGPLPHGVFPPPANAALSSGGTAPLAGGASTGEAPSMPREPSAARPYATGGGGGPGDDGAESLLSLVFTSCAAGAGSHGGGAGAVAVAARRYEFVAPGQLGPRCQGPALGRPVDFTDPIERPG